MSEVARNLRRVQERIRAAAERSGRDPQDVKLVVVTKTVPPDRIREAIEAGATILGENYVQEARRKIAELGHPVSWHLIGHLQTNKAKQAVELFEMIHSVDSLRVARELDRRAGRARRVARVLLQVNLSGEATKSGLRPDEVMPLLRELVGFPHLSVEGLMTLPPFSPDPEDVRVYFRALRELRERIFEEMGVPLRELSMGMSHDFEVAVEEGATMVRVGTAIFGSRN